MTAGAELAKEDAKLAVLKACRNYLDSAEHFEAHYRLIFDNAERGYEPLDAAKAVGAAAFKVLNDLVAHLLPDSASKAKRHDAAMQVWSVVHGFVGLKHHPVAQLVDMRHWRARAMQVLEILVDAMADGRTG